MKVKWNWKLKLNKMEIENKSEIKSNETEN